MDLSSLTYTTKTTRDFPLNNKLLIAGRSLGDLADWLYVCAPPLLPHPIPQHLQCWEPRGDQLKPFLIRFRCKGHEVRFDTPETIVTPYSAHSQVRWGRKWLNLHPSGVMFDSISIAPTGRPCFLEKIILTNKEPSPVEIEIIAGGSFLRSQDHGVAAGAVNASYPQGTMAIASNWLEFREAGLEDWQSQGVAYTTDYRAPNNLAYFLSRKTAVIQPEEEFSIVVGEWLGMPGDSHASNLASLKAAIGAFDTLLEETRDFWARALGEAPRLECPDPVVTSAWNWSWVNLELLDRTSPQCAWLPHVEYTSLSHLPPVYAWDHLYTTMAQLYYRPDWSKQVFREFLIRQWDDGYIDSTIRPDGKPDHLMLQTHAIYALAFWNYLRATGDVAFLKETINGRTVFERLKLAFDWYKHGGKYITCFDHGRIMDRFETRETKFLRDKTGLIWGPGLGDHGADTALYRKWDNEWVDMNAYLCQGLRAMERISALAGEDALGAHYAAWAKKAKASINRLMWDPGKRFYFDLDHDGSRLDAITVGPLAVLNSDIPGPKHLRGIIDMLCDPDHLDRPFGIPNVSASHPDYYPRQYFWFGLSAPHLFFNAILGLYNRKKGPLAWALYRKFLHAYSRWDGGPRYLYETWNPDNGMGQWSGNYNWTSMAVLPVLIGAAGLRCDIDGAHLEPALPPGWKSLEIHGLKLKGGIYDIKVAGKRGELAPRT